MANGLPPASFIRVAGSSLDSVIEAIKTTTDAKTLASPKVAVLNGQEAKIQIGSQLGYFVTTTTQTSTLQSVNFLDTGVILHVTPVISDDNQVIMTVKPQVSSGRINPTTQLPESDTTEVQTKVMLMDGEAIVIGGLIKETDSDIQNKIPILGDIWLLGRLFQKRATIRERSEIIITLTPTIVPDAPLCRQFDPHEVARATTPLLAGPLVPMNRTVWEPELENCYERRTLRRDSNCVPVDNRGVYAPGPAMYDLGPHPLPPARMEEVWPAETLGPGHARLSPERRATLYRLPAVETETPILRR